MKNRGLNHNRIAREPLEKLFAEQWEKQNISPVTGKLDGKGTLDYILAKDPNRPCSEVSDRDREVAATVIQWLGSPVGESFLSATLEPDFVRETLKSDVAVSRSQVLSVISHSIELLEKALRPGWSTETLLEPLFRLQKKLSQTTEEYLSEKGW